MLASVPAWKIERWRTYEQLEPFATERLGWQLAALLKNYHNVHSDKPVDFEALLRVVPVEQPPELTPEQRQSAEIANARAAAAADKARRGA